MRKRNVIDRRRLMIRAADRRMRPLGRERHHQGGPRQGGRAHRARSTSGEPRTVARARIYRDRSTPEFRANGTVTPDDDDYQEQSAKGFADWSLDLGGLVERPATFSLTELRALPSRTQITRHDCVEGWSCVGKWKGVPVREVIERVGLKPAARYLMFYCADPMNVGDPESKYYESIDMDEALHPQTILAYDMNDKALDIPHGAPLRLRVERQLGYKMAKYIMRIEAVESFASFRGGKGGYWEDLGYAWYAGI
jgi:DMSO/TMAO reductase YedYZ molybdopterin-dependent catalytic subunit